MHHRYLKYIVSYFLGIGVVSTIAVVGTTQETRQPHELLEKLYSCGTIESLGARNDCYKKAAEALKNAEHIGEVLIINQQEFKQIREAVFGYNNILIDGIEFRDLNQLSKLESISVPVRKVERYLSGYVVSLDNNQVWEQFAGSITRVPKGKLFAKINVTPTGNYKMVLFNDKARVSNIRVRRIK